RRVIEERGQVLRCRRAAIVGAAVTASAETHPHAVAFDGLEQSLGLGGTEQDAESAPKNRAAASEASRARRERRPRESHAWTEISSIGFIPVLGAGGAESGGRGLIEWRKAKVRTAHQSAVGIKPHVEVAIFTHGREVFIAQTVIQGDIRADS